MYYLVWRRSLTPPSKIGKGSGELRIIDLCHKQKSGSSTSRKAAAPISVCVCVVCACVCIWAEPVLTRRERTGCNRICCAARKTAAPITLQYSNGHLGKHVARYVTPLSLMLFMTSYIMLYGTNPGLGLQPILPLRVRTGAAHLVCVCVCVCVCVHACVRSSACPPYGIYRFSQQSLQL